MNTATIVQKRWNYTVTSIACTNRLWSSRNIIFFIGIRPECAD